MDFAELLAGKRGLALHCNLALIIAVAFAPPARLTRSGTIVLSRFLARFKAWFLAQVLAQVLARFLAQFLARFLAIVVSPAVVVLIMIISEPHRLAVNFVAALNDGIEPFPNRHAGAASGVPGSFARFWTETSEIPRTARFHCAPKPHPEERGMALF